MRTLPVLVSSRPREAGLPAARMIDAGFAAQMLGQGMGQGGARRGLRGGPGFLARAHRSYEAAGRAQPCAPRARVSI
jgi:hypothetical protein